MKQKEYWNKVAYNKNFTTPLFINEFSKYISKNDYILDYGCGYGRTLNELHKNAYENLFGIDFSFKMIERGKKLYPYLNLECCNGITIPYIANSFDAVLLFAVLTCIVNNNSQIALIKEIKRVLKPDGIISVNDFLLNFDNRNCNRYNTYEKEFNIFGVFKTEDGAVVRHHRENWIKYIFSDFNEIQFSRKKYKTMNGNFSNAFFYLGRINK